MHTVNYAPLIFLCVAGAVAIIGPMIFKKRRSSLLDRIGRRQ